MRALFPRDAERRRFLKTVGTGTALAAISSIFPLGLAKEVFAETNGPLEKTKLSVGFIPITCATPIIMAHPLGYYSKYGLDVEVVAIATRSKGSLISDRALDLEAVLKELESTGSLMGHPGARTDLGPTDIIDKTVADMVVELTTLNIDTGRPAIDHITRAMECGMDVVTANKGPVAFAYSDLRALARSRGVHFRFEGTVMDGTPIFSLVEKTLPGCQVLGVRGILNSTSNYVLTEMAKGRTAQDAVKEAQALGIAEADPSMDMDGWDAAAKITALANVLMDARKTPKDVDRTGVRDISSKELADAKTNGKRIRLIATAAVDGEDIRLVVRPEAVAALQPDELLMGRLQLIVPLRHERAHGVHVIAPSEQVDRYLESGGLLHEIQVGQLRIHRGEGLDEPARVVHLVHVAVLRRDERQEALDHQHQRKRREQHVRQHARGAYFPRPGLFRYLKKSEEGSSTMTSVLLRRLAR